MFVEPAAIFAVGLRRLTGNLMFPVQKRFVNFGPWQRDPAPNDRLTTSLPAVPLMSVDHCIWLWRAVIQIWTSPQDSEGSNDHSGRKRVQYAEGYMCRRLVRWLSVLRGDTCSCSSCCERTQALVTCAYADCASPIWFFSQNMAARSHDQANDVVSAFVMPCPSILDNNDAGESSECRGPQAFAET